MARSEVLHIAEYVAHVHNEQRVDSVEISDRGAAYLDVKVWDVDGNVLEDRHRLVFPVGNRLH